jgi:hypothetical protein
MVTVALAGDARVVVVVDALEATPLPAAIPAPAKSSATTRVRPLCTTTSLLVRQHPKEARFTFLAFRGDVSVDYVGYEKEPP